MNVLQEAARHVQGYQCQYCQAATVSIIAGVVIASHAAWCPVRLRLQRSRP